MNRLYILPLLAIASLAFAVDNSLVSILRANTISDTSVTVSWQAINDAQNYKVFYDEESALKEGEEPIFDTDSTEKTQNTIKDLTPATAYILIVHGYNALGREVGKSIPLHLTTFHTVPFDLIWDPAVSKPNIINLQFTDVVDITKTSFESKLGVQKVSYDPKDMRKISITLKNSMKIGEVYDLNLAKVYSISGKSLPVDAQISLKVSYSPDPNAIFEQAVAEQNSPYTAPVAIDNLPQTGPTEIGLVILTVILSTFLVLHPKKVQK